MPKFDATRRREASRGHSDSVASLAVLPDGRRASSSSDDTIRLWEIAARREIAPLRSTARSVASTALSDSRLVAGADLGSLHWLEIGD